MSELNLYRDAHRLNGVAGSLEIFAHNAEFDVDGYDSALRLMADTLREIAGKMMEADANQELRPEASDAGE